MGLGSESVAERDWNPAQQPSGARRLWLNIGSPENLQLRVHGKLVHVTGHRPRVILVTTTGWRPA